MALTVESLMRTSGSLLRMRETSIQPPSKPASTDLAWKVRHLRRT
jgi:hypothetical protein